jgi:hypothetical protein
MKIIGMPSRTSDFVSNFLLIVFMSMFLLIAVADSLVDSTVATFPPNASNDIIGGYLRGLDIQDDHGVCIFLLTANKIDLKVRKITDMDKARFEKDSGGFL